MLCGSLWSPDDDGSFFIDRSPMFFERIMASLRSGNPIDNSGLSFDEAVQLRHDVDYYQLPSGIFTMPTIWDACHCSSKVVISKDGRTVTANGDFLNNGGAVLATTPNVGFCHIRILHLGEAGPLRVGYMRGIAYKPDQFNDDGWFVLSNGDLFCRARGVVPRYCPELRRGDLVSAQFDKEAQTISFIVNGIDYGLAFQDVVSERTSIFPCVLLTSLHASVSLEEKSPWRDQKAYHV